MNNLARTLYVSLGNLVEPLLERISSLEALEYLFYRYGWDVELDDAMFTKISQSLRLRLPLEEFLSAIEHVQPQLAETTHSDHSGENLVSLAASADALVRALAELTPSSLTEFVPPFGEREFWNDIGEHLLNDLLEEYLRVYHSNLFLVLHLGGVIRYESMQPLSPFRRPYLKTSFDWEQVLRLARNPVDALRGTYKWGNPREPFEYQNFFSVLATVLRRIGVHATRFPSSLRAKSSLAGDHSSQIALDVDALRMTLLDDYSLSNQSFYEFFFELFPAIRDPEAVPSGLVLLPTLRGGDTSELALGNDCIVRWNVSADTGDALGVVLFPDEVKLVGGQVALATSLEVKSVRPAPWYLVGNEDTARIEFYGPSIRLSIEGTVDKPDPKLQIKGTGPNGQPGCRVIVPLDGSDGFLREIIQQSVLTFSFSPEFIWSSTAGITFNGSPNLDLGIPLNIELGSISLRNAHIAIGEGPKKTSTTNVALRVGVDLQGTLGPVQFIVEEVGFACNAIQYSRQDILASSLSIDGPVLGNLGLEMNFAPPKGVGLTINTDLVTGGGYLFFDSTKAEYNGILQLEVAERIAVKSIGLLTTRLLDGGKGYSLVLLIFAEHFTPIQLGLGFVLTGIGGLLGVNRTFSETALRAGLKNHSLDSVLFPKDVVRNASQIVSNLNLLFPPAKGHHVFGPMAQIAWGTPPLITADVGVVLEFGARQRLLMLAQIVAILPKREHDLVRLQMDAVGVVDFDHGTAELDATLYDSRLLKKFVLTGEMALRVQWEGSPHFALAIGGLHPAFTPPVNFPKLERIAINLTTGDNPRLRCEAYFAITANTVQFGARAEFYAAASGFSIQGEIGYDVLIQLDPFAFLADFYAQLQLKRGSRNLFKVRFEGTLAGPRPLHIRGKATFEVLWWDVSIRVDKTLVEGETPPRAEPIEVMPRLLDAFESQSNWAGQLPVGQRPMVTLRGKPEATTEVLLHPIGTLTVKQNVVPLDLDITKFGSTTPSGARRFSITSVTQGGRPQTPIPVRDFFAPAQFVEMSDDEKLSSPSFESLPAGMSLGSSDFVFTEQLSDRLEVKTIEFETWIVDKKHQSSRPSRPQGPTRFYALSPVRLEQQARFGAAGSNARRRTGRVTDRTTVDKYQVEPEQWSVVTTENLTAPLTSGSSYSEAKEMFRRLRQTNPEKARGLQLIRFQSEVQAVS